MRTTAPKPIARVSKRQRELLREYALVKSKWRAMPENWQCRFTGCKQPAQESPHHARGRVGLLLCDCRYWIPLCDLHHDWVHSNPEHARALGLLCERGKWGVRD